MYDSALTMAKWYLEIGWSLIPIVPETKIPAVKWTPYQEQRATLEEITSWVNRGWHLAVVTGEISGVVVIDDDRVKHGLPEWGFESPVVSRSENKGKHYYFRYDRELHSHSNTTIRVDLKGWHSYCVVPPFKNRTWVDKPSKENLLLLKPLPEDIVQLVCSDLKQTNGEQKKLHIPGLLNVGEGGRTNALYQLGCSYFRTLSIDDALRRLREANSGYNPPLDQKEFVYQTERARKYISENPLPQSTPFEQKKDPAIIENPLTDFGNAERLAQQYKGKLKYNTSLKKWFFWNGVVWVEDTIKYVERCVQDSVRKLRKDANSIENEKERSRVIKWALKSESKAILDATRRIAEGQLVFVSNGKGWDEKPMLFACQNGVIDLTTGELNEGNPDDLLTIQAPVTHELGAEREVWERFIDETFQGDSNLIHWIQKAMGYTLTGHNNEEMLFFCYGDGGNGKSKFFEALSFVFGQYQGELQEYTVSLHKDVKENVTDILTLKNKRFCVFDETQKKTKLNEARLKKWSSAKKEEARVLGTSNIVSFRIQFKMWFFFNHLPNINDETEGWWRRIRYIHFEYTVPEDKIDKNLLKKLEKEASGILNWLIEGCLMYQAEGLGDVPAKVVRATKEQKENNDPLDLFIQDVCEIGEDFTQAPAEFYPIYAQWARKQELKPWEIIDSKDFGQRMKKKFVYKQDKKDGKRYYYGVRVKSEWMIQVSF